MGFEAIEVDQKEQEEKRETKRKRKRKRKRDEEEEELEEGGSKSKRPSRERKKVERYSAVSPRRTSASKSLLIEQGSGTKLRDIPNVVFKLSKRKADDSLQALHRILFGKRSNVHFLKRNILQFSGFVWTENEEKLKSKLKEKFDKYTKEKLIDFCGLLDIQFPKATKKKEDVSAKLLEFLESPHITRDLLIADQEKKGKRRRSRTKSVEEAAVDASSDKETKGSGTKLRDIPNVVFKLSKRKADDSLQALHRLLFGKRSNVHFLKRNILQFSGFVWTENEEKLKSKLKEKLDKYTKEKLIDFCGLLAIRFPEATTKKEDVSAKLLEFLESPHITRDLLIADKEKKGKRRRSRTKSVEEAAVDASSDKETKG